VTEEHRMNALEERSSLAFGTPLCRARLPSAPPFAVSDALTTVICSVLVQGVSSGQLLAHSYCSCAEISQEFCAIVCIRHPRSVDCVDAV
jgi:hypothetical protein